MPSENERFSKWQSYFVATANLPFASCAACRHFRAPDRCAIVTEAGNPLPGEIRPTSTCKLWNAGPGRQLATALLRGRGSTPGVAPGNLRVRIEEVFIPPPRTDPPPEVRDRLVFPCTSRFAR